MSSRTTMFWPVGRSISAAWHRGIGTSTSWAIPLKNVTSRS
jgi:hypothetical protein